MLAFVLNLISLLKKYFLGSIARRIYNAQLVTKEAQLKYIIKKEITVK